MATKDDAGKDSTGKELSKTAGDAAGERAAEAKKAAKKGFAGLAEAAKNAKDTQQIQAVVVEMCNELATWK